MPSNTPVSRFFVYWTLKRGECREHAWPHTPESVTPATTKGQLFDLGDYPAMVHGNDQVVGELWCIPSHGLADTLRVLDAIEGYDFQRDENLYERQIVECCDEDGSLVKAWTYFFGRALPEENRIHANAEGKVSWEAGRG